MYFAIFMLCFFGVCLSGAVGIGLISNDKIIGGISCIVLTLVLAGGCVWATNTDIHQTEVNRCSIAQQQLQDFVDDGWAIIKILTEESSPTEGELYDPTMNCYVVHRKFSNGSEIDGLIMKDPKSDNLKLVILDDPGLTPPEKVEAGAN